MASKQAVATALMAAKAVFPHLWKDADIQQTAATWSMLFQHVPDECFTQAYFAVLQKATYPPVPGEITAEMKKKATNSTNSSVEWDQLVKACETVNDLRTEFAYTYIPEGESMTQGQQARIKANGVFDDLPHALQDYIGSASALLQYAQEMNTTDTTGMQIRRREYEKWRSDYVSSSSLQDLLEEPKTQYLPEFD